MKKILPLVCVFLLVGCATHRPSGAQFRSATDMVTQQEVDGVVWALDGLGGVEFDRVYDWKFAQRGYSAAILAVRNNSDVPVRLSWQNIEGAIDPEEIVKKSQRVIPGRLVLWNLASLIELIALGDIYLDGITLSVIGIFDATAAGNANRQMADDIRRQSVRDSVIPPNRSSEGLIYFRGAPRNVRVLYMQGEESKQIEIPWR